MRREISEQEFLDFAHSYLSEAFPNPQRVRCPRDWDLIRMSEHPRDVDTSVHEHIAYCSPCFNRYMDILGELKRRMRASRE
jgi:hypothetical protein